MGNPYPVAIIDDSGTTRLEGEATFTDPANQPGGVAPSYLRALIVAPTPFVASTPVSLPWTVAGSAGADIALNADPTKIDILTPGLYAVQWYAEWQTTTLPATTQQVNLVGIAEGITSAFELINPAGVATYGQYNGCQIAWGTPTPLHVAAYFEGDGGTLRDTCAIYVVKLS